MRLLAEEALEARDFDDVLELMHGHWDCLEAAVRGEELFALELALRDEPQRDHAAT